ncbi:MAG: xylulokinase [Candidatus Aminicenantes bacterium]|nr:xylulokinase [Candidatus Aminicenantes bacterium]
MGATVIGVDSGTQGVKAVVVDVDSGRVVGRGRAPHDSVPGLPPGASEQDPDIWVSAMNNALREALTDSDPKQVVALGVSGQQHGFVPLDEKGRVIRPAKLWNDTSTVAETQEIIMALGGPAGVLEKIGIGLAVGFTAGKIRWLKMHEPEHYARLRTVLLPHNYLNFILTGERRMEYGDASGTGLMDIRNRVWSPDAAAAVDPGLMACLPPLHPPSEPVGRVKNEFAESFGLGDVLVAAGSGDNMMGAIGTGNVSPGICTVSLGTSGTIYSYSPVPSVDPRGEIAGFCDGTGAWLPLLCTMNVTNVTELWKSVLGLDNAARDELAARAPAGSSGLIFLPFVDGERVPALPGASAVFFGLNRVNFTPAAMTRAVMEGTLLNLGYGLGRLRALGIVPSEIRATGGASRSLFWLQLAADIFQAPVVTLAEPEGAAFGAALQAIWTWRKERGEKVGIETLAGALVKTSGEAVEPHPGHRGLYAERQDRFNALWKRLAPEFESRRSG